MKSTHNPSTFPIADMTTQHLAGVGKLPVPEHKREQGPDPVRGWMLLPLRLFLSITFFYAGVQKLTDPHFFRKATPGYIGNQIIGFAQGSPLKFVLIHAVLPHAVLFGWAIALGEIAIGLGALCGLLFRPAACFGLLLSILFFLTASFHVFPYFYGSDIVFAFSWLTLALTGPANTGLPAIDLWLQRRLFPQGLADKGWIERSLGIMLLGMNTLRPQLVPESVPAGKGPRDQRFAAYQQRRERREKRRAFLQGLALGGVGVAGLAVLGSFMHLFDRTTSTAPGASSPGASATPAAAPGGAIAQVNAVPENSAVTFTIPSSGDPGVLIHLPNQQFVAFDATCTHAGCAVGYDSASGRLICPCHGAEFDPTNQAAVLQGPAPTPLTPVSIHVDQATGTITLA